MPSLLGIVFVLIAIGVVLWLVNRYIPMDAKIKTVLNWVVMIVVILWLLNLFFPGFFGAINSVPVRPVR